MIVVVVSLKGGVGKTTTAFHIAEYLQASAPTVLVDGDPNRSAIAWSEQAESLPFEVISEKQITYHAGRFAHSVIDTQARPTIDDFKDLAAIANMLILPCPPEFLDLTALIETSQILDKLGCKKYKALLTKVPTNANSTDEASARELLNEAGVPVFKGRIRFYKAYGKAVIGGSAVNRVKGDRNAKLAWNDYKTVLDEMMQEINGG